MTRQRYHQLRRAVEQGRAIAELVTPAVPFRPFTAEEQADYERRMDARDEAYDDNEVPEREDERDDEPNSEDDE